MKFTESVQSTLKIVPFIFILFLISGCGEEYYAQRIVDNAIRAHGGRVYENLELEFDFRDYHYRMNRQGGLFSYERIFQDTLGNKVEDKLTNDGFTRKINGEQVELTEERRNAYKNSVNSVFYFALLPYGLNDPAVRKTLVGTSSIGGTDYQIVEVTFEEEGGGEDFEDVFYFWFRQDKYYMDYMAYTYETDGGGVRFREAINQRVENGIRFQDYKNYKPEDKNTPISELGELFVRGDLILLSEINMKNISVK